MSSAFADHADHDHDSNPDGDEDDDRDSDEDAPEGSFFGASDELACNRVWNMFAKKSVKDGFGADLQDAHDRQFPAKPQSSKFVFDRGTATVK